MQPAAGAQPLTAEAGLDAVGRVNKRLPLRGRQRAGVDEAVDLIEEGIELIAGGAALSAVELGAGPVELGDQAGALAQTGY
jgi:hypothetical protein